MDHGLDIVVLLHGDGQYAPEILAGHGLIEIDHADFAYPGGEPVLTDITLRVQPGERLAIVGASGSGKSTLALLLARFYDPSAGQIRIDGQDLRDCSVASVRRAVSSENLPAARGPRTTEGHGGPPVLDCDVCGGCNRRSG